MNTDFEMRFTHKLAAKSLLLISMLVLETHGYFDRQPYSNRTVSDDVIMFVIIRFCLIQKSAGTFETMAKA